VAGNLSLDPSNVTTLSISDLSPASFTNGALVFIDYSGTWNGGLFTVNGTVIHDNADTFSVNGNTYQIDYDYGGAGGAVALLAVPEPGAGVGLLGGLVVLIGGGRPRPAIADQFVALVACLFSESKFAELRKSVFLPSCSTVSFHATTWSTW
jgi:hypothetical protein